MFDWMEELEQLRKEQNPRSTSFEPLPLHAPSFPQEPPPELAEEEPSEKSHVIIIDLFS